MKRTIYACFETLDDAHRAIGDLVKGGEAADNIRVVCKRTTEARPAVNPAQDDYPRTGTPEDHLSSAPPSAQRDYNKGLESDDYNRDYRADVQGDIDRQESKDRRRQHIEGPAPDEAYQNAHQSEAPDRGSEPPALDESKVSYGAMPAAFPDLRSGGQDGAADPMYSGPGTRSAQIAATASGSDSGGGMTDFLWSSLPVDIAADLRRQYEDGKAIVMVHEPGERAEGVLRDHGAHLVKKQGYLA